MGSMQIKWIMAIALVMMLCLAGCQNNMQQQWVGKVTEAQMPNPNKETQKMQSKEEEITITMMISGSVLSEEEDFDTMTFPKLVKERYPNINLVVTKLVDDLYHSTLRTKLAMGAAPDIMLVQPGTAGPTSAFELAKAGYLADLSDLNWMDKTQKTVQDMTYEGKIVAVAQGHGYLGTYYNKKIFEENHLKVPTDWEEFLETCETLKQAGIVPIVMGDKDSYVMQFGLYQIAANQIYPQNPEFDAQLRDGQTRFTGGEWERVLSMYASLYQKGYVMEDSLSIGLIQAIRKFSDGEAAMIFGGGFSAAAILKEGGMPFERGYFPLPANDKGQALYISAATIAGNAIYSKSEHIEECKAILQLLSDDETRQASAQTRGNIRDTGIFDRLDEIYSTGRSFYFCNQAWPYGVEAAMESGFSELIGGQPTSPQSIAAAMQQAFEEAANAEEQSSLK